MKMLRGPSQKRPKPPSNHARTGVDAWMGTVTVAELPSTHWMRLSNFAMKNICNEYLELAPGGAAKTWKIWNSFSWKFDVFCVFLHIWGVFKGSEAGFLSIDIDFLRRIDRRPLFFLKMPKTQFSRFSIFQIFFRNVDRILIGF